MSVSPCLMIAVVGTLTVTESTSRVLAVPPGSIAAMRPSSWTSPPVSRSCVWSAAPADDRVTAMSTWSACLMPVSVMLPCIPFPLNLRSTVPDGTPVSLNRPTPSRVVDSAVPGTLTTMV